MKHQRWKTYYRKTSHNFQKTVLRKTKPGDQSTDFRKTNCWRKRHRTLPEEPLLWKPENQHRKTQEPRRKDRKTTAFRRTRKQNSGERNPPRNPVGVAKIDRSETGGATGKEATTSTSLSSTRGGRAREGKPQKKVIRGRKVPDKVTVQCHHLDH